MYPGDWFEIRYMYVVPQLLVQRKRVCVSCAAERKLLTITCRGCQLRSRLSCCCKVKVARSQDAPMFGTQLTGKKEQLTKWMRRRASENERANEIGLLVIWRIKNYTCFCLSWLYRYHKVMLRRMQRELLVSQQGQKFILLHWMRPLSVSRFSGALRFRSNLAFSLQIEKWVKLKVQNFSQKTHKNAQIGFFFRQAWKFIANKNWNGFC